MGDAEKKICMLASQKDQPCSQKPIALKPYPFLGPSKLIRSADSPFQVWQNPSVNDNLGEVEGHNNPELELKLAISDTFSAQAIKNCNNTVKNYTLDQAEKTIINGSFEAPSVGVNVNTSQICEGQARQSSCLDLNLAIMNEDPKRLRRMANRVYSQKYRLKKTKHITNLEDLTRNLMSKNLITRQGIEENKIKNRALLLEHHQLKFEIAALEKDRILKEAEIEKNMAEVKRLRELQANQLQASRVHAKPK